MDSRSLLYFIAVAEERNIGRAAARLHITQPALTRQIRALEEDVGVLLFQRTSTGVAITPAGSALLVHARNIKAELARARLAARQSDQAEPQVLHLGVHGSVVFSVVPQVLRRLADGLPNLRFMLHSARKDQQVEMLRDRRILAAFDRFPLQHPDLGYETVYRETLQVALHHEHPLASRSVIHRDDLADQPRIGANFDRELATNLGRATGTSQPATHGADDVLAALALVSQGLGIAFAPPSIQALQIPGVVFRPYADNPMVPFDVQCIYAQHETSPLLQALLSAVRDVCALQQATRTGPA